MLEKVAEGGGVITSPTFDSHRVLHICSTSSGDIFKVVEGELQHVCNTKGQPSCVTFDPLSGVMVVCDLLHQSVLRMEETETGESTLIEFVKEYEGKTFKGPNSLCCDKYGNIYFTDSGPLGETTLSDPLGSVFTVTAEGQVLRPLIFEGLAHPAGICCSPDGNCIYVCELLKNRVLRLTQSPVGVFHTSVFYTFSGYLGPSAVSCDDVGNLFVARYDFRSNGEQGLLSVISAAGQSMVEMSIPGPEITGLQFEGESKKLYISEASNSTVYSYSMAEPISQ